MRDERSLSTVPGWVQVLLALALAAQVGWGLRHAQQGFRAVDLPAPPTPEALRLASLGERSTGARLAMLYLQAFDLSGEHGIPYQRLDYSRVIGWLDAILRTDPGSQYPLFSAARIYAEVPDHKKMRAMLQFIHATFPEDPDRRWQWLAHAALLAKHRLGDLALARRYAADIDRLTTARDVPLWARQMEIFILEDMNELEAAKVMIGGLLASGKIEDAAEARFLRERLAELEQRLSRRGKSLPKQ